MLKKQTLITYEKRPVERRGIKRATPFCEMSSSEKEMLLSNLLSLSRFSDSTNVSFWQSDTYQNSMLNLLTSANHLLIQTNYLRNKLQ